MKRWPIIRHVRWLWHSYHFNRHAAHWMALGYFPQQSDIDRLKAIKDGHA